MTLQERPYMGKPEEQSESVKTDFVNPCDLLYTTIAELKSKISVLEQSERRLLQECDAASTSLNVERSAKEAAQAEAAANLKALLKAQQLVQKQGEALIAEHYGVSKFKLLIVARSLLSMAEPAKTPERYRPPGQSQEQADELWRSCVANWFDDFEKEMRAVACEPVQSGELF